MVRTWNRGHLIAIAIAVLIGIAFATGPPWWFNYIGVGDDNASTGLKPTPTIVVATTTTTTQPATTAPATPITRSATSRYLTDEQAVASECEPFYFHNAVGAMPINGKSHLHVLSAGRDGDIGRSQQGPCYFDYNLGRSANQLHATFGVSDESESTFSCAVEIVADESGLQSEQASLGSEIAIELDVRNVLRVRFSFTFLGPGGGECALAELRVT